MPMRLFSFSSGPMVTLRVRHVVVLAGLMAAVPMMLHWTASARGMGEAQPAQVDRTGQPWTREDARAHADRYNDPALWSMKFLKGDVASDKDNAANRASLAFPRTAFNTPDYELTGRVMHGLMSTPLPVAQPMAGVLVGVHEALELKDVPAGKQWHDVVRAEPVVAIVANGPAPISDQGTMIVSRSHPHYFFQGALASKHGEIRWVAVRMADGTSMAIVNGRVLDLGQGNLILIRQHEDGSIRIYQHAEKLQTARGADLRRSIPEMLKQEAMVRALNQEK